MSSTAKVTTIFSAPGFSPLTPEDVTRETQKTIYTWGGVTIDKIRDNLVVKYGKSVKVHEARALLYVKEHTSIPVPRVYSVFTYGPVADDSAEGVSWTHTYIVMDHVPGKPLDEVWPALDASAKSDVCRKLSRYVQQLRSLSSPRYVGAVHNTPVQDSILENQAEQGPFASVDGFHRALAQAYARRHRGNIGSYVLGLLNTSQYDIKFTHADLRQANILVQDNGDINAIVDWEMAGWYPEYWEFVKMYSVYRFHDDWGQHILENFRPYFAESAAYVYIASLLW